MSFIAIDLTLFVLFTLIAILFLYKHKKNLERQGILYLYKTKIGIKIINYTSKKYSKLLKALEYLIIFCGFILMILMIYLLVKFSITYIGSSYLAKAIKIPVLLPLFPYIPSLFKLDFLPPFYFTYWVIIIAIVAIPHEFFHGIFAKLSKIKVHSTGFGFLGPFLAFFVEPDEKQMNKIGKKEQMAILASGTFANILVTIVFALIMWAFFSLAFIPAGVQFNTYAITPINASQITGISNVTFANITYGEINVNNKTYFITLDIVSFVKEGKVSAFLAYDNSPAFNAQLKGAISQIDNVKINSYNDLNQTLNNYGSGDQIKITTIIGKTGTKTKEYNIQLGERNGKAFLGIGIIPNKPSGIMGFFYSFISKIKHPEVYYQSRIGDFGIFINDLLWWLIIINLSVALMNMLPLGIFDGGKFFLLTIWGITKSKKAGEIAYKISTWVLLLLVLALMLKWALAIF